MDVYRLQPCEMARTIEWRHLWREGGGIERLTLEAQRAVGHIDCTSGARPFQLDYEARWDLRWDTRFLSYRLQAGGSTLYKSLSGDGAGYWAVDGQPDKRLSGCLDADLWPTPFTNTLAIRRLLTASQTDATIQVAWVDAFEGTVRAREQRYTLLTPARWRFESVEDGFVTELTVDDDGIVIDYPGLFERS